jgi:hypothetical protein
MSNAYIVVPYQLLHFNLRLSLGKQILAGCSVLMFLLEPKEKGGRGGSCVGLFYCEYSLLP